MTLLLVALIQKVFPKSKLSFATREVVDEVFINLPNESYNIGEFVSQFEAMGIDVSVNINGLSFISMGEKRVREVAGLSVVTFSTNFYKYGHVLAKRMLDIYWFSGRSLLLWLSCACFSSTYQERWRACYLCAGENWKEWTTLQVLSSGQCILMRRNGKKI